MITVIILKYRVPTVLKDGQAHPAQDMLMRHMIELANAENPPCANCDKRDKNNMYFCITCGKFFII